MCHLPSLPRMYRVVILVVGVAAIVSRSAAQDTTFLLPAVGIRASVPVPTIATIGTWSLAHYSSAEIYSTQLTVPVPVASSEPPTAFSATYGDSLHVMVAVVPEFLGSVDLLGRLLDLQQLRRSARGEAPVMVTYTAQKMIGAVPAEEIAIELRDTTNRDSMFTLITAGQRGRDIVVLFLRSRTNPRDGSTWSALAYQQLLASVAMPELFRQDTLHIVHPAGWSIAIPHAWTNKVSTRSGQMPLLPPQTEEDTTWNSVVVQLPAVQIEFFANRVTLGDTAVLDYAAHVAQRQRLEPLSSWTHIPGWQWYRFLAPHRGNTVQTTYGICVQQGHIRALRLTGWERDMPHVEGFLPLVIEAFAFPLSSAR